MHRKQSLFWTVVLLIVGVAYTALPLGAQQPAARRIVLISGERVTQETQVGRDVRQRIMSEVEQWQSRLETERTELDALVQRRREGALTLNQTALADLDAQIEEKQVALQRLEDDARRAIDRLQSQGAEEVNAALVPLLERIAREQGYELVLDTGLTQVGGILYFSPELDVTDEFIARVNASGAPQQQP